MIQMFLLSFLTTISKMHLDLAVLPFRPRRELKSSLQKLQVPKRDAISTVDP